MTGSDHDITPQVRQMQIIAAALMAGLVMFTGIAFMIADQPGDPLVAYIMAGMVVMEIGPFFFIPQTILKQAAARKGGRAEQGGIPREELNAYQTAMLIQYALCEGAGFANAVAYIVSGQWWSLAIVGFLLLIMLAMFPTKTRLEHWLETRRFEAEQQG